MKGDAFLRNDPAHPDPVRTWVRFKHDHPLRRVEVGRQVWSYHELGRGPYALVFLHGLAGSGDIWFQQLLRFAREYRVLAPTYPPLATLDQLTDGVWAFLDRLGIERAQLVGSSLGGLVVQKMIAQQPDRIERAVLGNTFPPSHPDLGRNRLLSMLAKALPTKTVFAYMKRQLRLNAPAIEPGDRLQRAYLLHQYDGGMSREQLIARLAAVFGDFELAAPPMPHAIIESLDEPLLTRAVRADLKRLYPRAWVYTFKRGGHFPYLTQPEEYNRALEAFLNASHA